MNSDDVTFQGKHHDKGFPDYQGSERENEGEISLHGTHAPDILAVTELPRMKGVGETLGSRYVLEKCIGFGSVGTVYKAFDLRQFEKLSPKPYVALKVLRIALHDAPALQQSFDRAVQKMHALVHPNILAVHKFHVEGRLAYFTMEYVPGNSLGHLLKAPGFAGMSVQQAMPFISGMVKALAHAHQHGCVHSDLKPANVLIRSGNQIKVTDFGLAQVLQHAKEKIELSAFDTSTLRGLTRAYVSPELLAHEPPDPRDDMYSLACITYELLTGRHPFDQVLASHAKDAGMVPIRPKHLDQRQWRALSEALSLDRQSRAGDLSQFLNDMRTHPPQRFLRKIGAPAIAIVGVAALAMLFLLKQYSGDNAVKAANSILAKVTSFKRPEANAAKPGQTAATSVTEGAGGAAGATAAPDNLIVSTAPVAALSKLPAQPIAVASVMPVLSSIPCSALAATVSDNTVDVKGYVSRAYGIAQLNATLAKIPGVENMKLDVQQIGEKDCGIVQLLAPYWQKSRKAGASIQPRNNDARMVEGDSLIVDVKTPNHDSWVYVDYYSLDGSAVHLLPSLRARDNQAPAAYSATVGGQGNWIVSPPFGTEMVVLLTTPTLLFSGLRAEREATPDYLAALEKELRQIEATHGPDRIAVEFLQIQTQSKK